MKINYKDIIQIITISIILSFFRYLSLEDYSFFKKSKLQEVNLDINELDSLYSLISNLELPTVLDLKSSKILYDNNLVTFIDARDIESYNEQRIASSINNVSGYILLRITQYPSFWTISDKLPIN